MQTESSEIYSAAKGINLGRTSFHLQKSAALAEAFRTRWITPRREAAKQVIQAAIRNKELRPAIDLDQALDALYGGLYYRLKIGSGPKPGQPAGAELRRDS
jgi:hypothetical protein